MLETQPVQIPAWLREVFSPDKQAAVEYFRRFVDEGMLLEIAQADYIDGAETHLAALKPIREGNEVGEMDVWYPGEVLELVRWSEPNDPNSGCPDAPSVLRGHQMRAFCCAVLLASPTFEPHNVTLIQLMGSAMMMGDDALKATGGFLLWRIEGLRSDCEEERPFFALAIAAAAYLLDPSMEVSKEAELAAWLSEEENAEREHRVKHDPHYRTVPWLLGLTWTEMRHDRWRELMRKMANQSGTGPLGQLLSVIHQG
ncbi:MAG: hypothetical protein JWM59_3921 [Verrucomicrobiales bacterium]|nr:hypothetical protein [Verrucomicrobiales bacterium]